MNHLFRGILIGVTAMICAGGCSQQDASSQEGASSTEQTVAIRYVETVAELPSEWRDLDPKPVIEPISGDRTETTRLIRGFLSDYPEGFLTKHVSEIRIYAKLQIRGYDYLGTYELPSTVHLVVPDDLHPGWVELAIHSEISSLLYHKYPELVFKAGLEYGLGKAPSQVGDVSVERDENMLRQGFISSYAATSPEEDFNTISAALLSGNSTIWEDAAEFKAFGEKYERVMQFYKAVDSRFTREYFEDILKFDD